MSDVARTVEILCSKRHHLMVVPPTRISLYQMFHILKAIWLIIEIVDAVSIMIFFTWVSVGYQSYD